MIILDFEPIVQSIAGGFSVREFTIMFHSVNEIAQFATIANRQPFPVHFNYKDSRLDAKSILSLCAPAADTRFRRTAGSRGGRLLPFGHCAVPL